MRFLPLVGSFLGLAVSFIAASPASNGVQDAESQLLLRDVQFERAAGSSATYGKKLRILPLGASITFGYHSTDGNGYRQDLKQMLGGADVTYVGSQCSGIMQNGNNEGHGGKVISDMLGYAEIDYPLKPNVVLVFVGTNDMLYPVDPDNAPARMANLVTGLAANLPPKTLIMVGNLFIFNNGTTQGQTVQARIDKFNAALPGALRPLADNGINVAIADLSHALRRTDLFCDGEHPNDGGYAKMANVFANAIYRAAIYGRIPSPSKPTGTDVKCTPLPRTPIGTCSSTATTSSSSTSSTYATTTTANPPKVTS